jgi:predicted nucleic acid-binding protein
MVLVDTSVWIEHFRHGVSGLASLLHDGRVASHPAVVGELACGTLRQRATTLDLLRRLPGALVATDDEALHFLDRHRLSGRGLGWTDLHLLAAAALSQFPLWSLDRRLDDAGRRLRLAFKADPARPGQRNS